jgi:hypothetical protein
VKLTRLPTDDLAVALARAAPRALPEVFRSEGFCIWATRIAIEVARRHRVDAYALACGCRVTNADRSYQVDIGDPTAMRPGGWPGHLVAVLDRRWLVDLSLGQAARPALGIDVGPIAAAIDDPEPFLRGRSDLAGVVRDSLVVYRSRPTDRTYRVGRAWSIPAVELAGAVDALLAEIGR